MKTTVGLQVVGVVLESPWQTPIAHHLQPIQHLKLAFVTACNLIVDFVMYRKALSSFFSDKNLCLFVFSFLFTHVSF